MKNSAALSFDVNRNSQRYKLRKVVYFNNLKRGCNLKSHKIQEKMCL